MPLLCMQHRDGCNAHLLLHTLQLGTCMGLADTGTGAASDASCQRTFGIAFVASYDSTHMLFALKWEIRDAYVGRAVAVAVVLSL